MKKVLLGLFLLASCSSKVDFRQDREVFRDFVDHNTVQVVGERGTGSGFYLEIDDKFYVITNHHVCSTSTTGVVELVDYDTKDHYKALIVKKSFDYDLCIILPTFVPDDVFRRDLRLGDSPVSGQNVHVFGYPKGRPGVMTSGEVIQYEKMVVATFPEKDKCQNRFAPILDTMFGRLCLNEYYAVQITANIQPGSSGSPAFDNEGRVIGVIFAGRRDDPTHGYMVPVEHLKEFIQKAL